MISPFIRKTPQKEKSYSSALIIEYNERRCLDNIKIVLNIVIKIVGVNFKRKDILILRALMIISKNQ